MRESGLKIVSPRDKGLGPSGADCVSAPGKKVPGCGGNFRLTGNDPGSAVNIQVERFMPESGGGTARSVGEPATAPAGLFFR